MPLGLEVACDPLESTDRETRQASYLCQLPGYGSRLRSHPLADRPSHLLRQGRLELRSNDGKALDSASRALERRLDLGVTLGSLLDCLESRLRPLDRGMRHEQNASVVVG